MTRSVLPSQEQERRLHLAGFGRVAGLDEVGRGPIAGPVVAAAVILPDLVRRSKGFRLVRDSKTLSERQLERGAALVRRIAIAVGIGSASVDEIDREGIVPATKMAMRRALDALPAVPDHLLVDAVRLDWRLVPCTALVHGDARCTAVAAASVVAKVHRDALMRELDARFPGYGFGAHKGYCSRAHLTALARLGPCAAHRRSFAPVRPTLFAADRRPAGA